MFIKRVFKGISLAIFSQLRHRTLTIPRVKENNNNWINSCKIEKFLLSFLVKFALLRVIVRYLANTQTEMGVIVMPIFS